MAFSNGAKPIVSNGLVFCVDALDKHSYPGSGTTWSDLINSNNGTLTNGPVHNGVGFKEHELVVCTASLHPLLIV